LKKTLKGENSKMKNSDKSDQKEKTTKITRRNLLKTAAVATPAVLLATLSDKAIAAPNGTFPTMLSNLSVVSVSSTNMRISGRLTTITGSGIAALKVDIFSVASGSFVRWATVYTNGTGNFDITTLKPAADRKIQIVIDGNGTYSQPFPTFNRP